MSGILIGGQYKLKTKDNPMQSAHSALRCSAKSKRTGKPCGSPAVNGWSVCRMHGARGGAPLGTSNGNYRHGCSTKKTIAVIAKMRALMRSCLETIDTL